MSPRRLHPRASIVAALALAAIATSAYAAPSRLIVQFRDDDVEAAFTPKTRVERLGREIGVESAYLRRMALGAHLVELPAGTDARAAAAAAMANGGVKLAIPDRRRKAAKIPNDPNAGWDLGNGGWAINAHGAWDITTGSSSVVVAIVDTGILPHPDLAGRVLPGYDFIHDPKVANDGNGRDADPSDPGDWVSDTDLLDPDFKDCEVDGSSWHGTMVAGLVAANANNAQYTAGVDWSAKILPVRALGKCGGYDSDILDGAAWAAGFHVPGVPDNPNVAQVINMSLGGLDTETCDPQYNQLLAQILTPTGARAIVAAAGNDSDNADLNTPSSCPATIAVAATTSNGNKTNYTNTGASVDISAPGGSGSLAGTLILVILNGGDTVPNNEWGVGAGAGTSFATPLVTGTISLMLSVAPNLTPAQVRSILTSTAKPFDPGSSCTSTTCGAGVVNAQAAVAAALATAPPAHKVPALEYYHAGINQYFLTAQADEQAGIASGVISGWAPTGNSFLVWDAQAAGTLPVFRLFTVKFANKAAHFYTSDPAERDLRRVENGGDWTYEKIAYYLAEATNGVCAAGQTPIYRMFNNGLSGAPNHRFTQSLADYQTFTQTMGWIGEGVRFCAPQ